MALAQSRGAILGLLCVLGFLNYLDRMILAAVTPAVKAEFGLSDTGVGALAMTFAVVYAIAGIPLGALTDRISRKSMIGAAAALWSLCTAACAFSVSFGNLLWTRMGVAFAEAAFIPAAFATISDCYERERRFVPVSWLVVSLSLGSLAGLSLGGWLGGHFGWRNAFLVAGIPGILAALWTAFWLREPRRGQYDGLPAARDSNGAQANALRRLLANRPFVWLAVTAALNGFAPLGMATWLPSHFERTFHLPLATIGFLFGTAFGVGNCLGQFVGGRAATVLARRSASAPLMLSIGSNLLIVPGFLGVLWSDSALTASVLALVTSFVAVLGQVTQSTLVQNLVSPSERGLAQGVVGLLVAVIGMGAGPLLVGALSDAVMPTLGEARALQGALSLTQGIFLLAAFGAWRASVLLSRAGTFDGGRLPARD